MIAQAVARREEVAPDAIAGFALAFFALVPAFGLLFGLFGITCSAVALRRNAGGRRLAVAGMTLGIVFLFVQFAATILLFTCFGCRT